MFNFPLHNDTFETITNHELYLLPRGIYRVQNILADNYLFPVYQIRDGNSLLVSTSVYALIKHKGKFVRNHKFQTTNYYRPTFLTIDKEITRTRTIHRNTTGKITDKKRIIGLGAELIQEYITEIEEKYPGYVHILLQGGKDSSNILLADRKGKWIVVSSAPNTQLSIQFIERNNLDIEKFIPISNRTDNKYLLQEIIASDCFYSTQHFRWFRAVHDLVNEYDGKAIIWTGDIGDAAFTFHKTWHRSISYYANYELYGGMAMGIWHQIYKNFLNVPALTPYASPQFLDNLLYQFNPYFALTSGDVRPEIGETLLGRRVWYPGENPTPEPWHRNRHRSIPTYIQQLKTDGIDCQTNAALSWLVKKREYFGHYLERRSAKTNSRFYQTRNLLSKVIPLIRNKRLDIASREIK